MDDLLSKNLAMLAGHYLSAYKKDFNSTSDGLLSGLSGTILLQSVLHTTTGDERYENEISANVEKLFTHIENGTMMRILKMQQMPSFCYRSRNCRKCLYRNSWERCCICTITGCSG